MVVLYLVLAVLCSIWAWLYCTVPSLGCSVPAPGCIIPEPGCNVLYSTWTWPESWPVTRKRPWPPNLATRTGPPPLPQNQSVHAKVCRLLSCCKRRDRWRHFNAFIQQKYRGSNMGEGGENMFSIVANNRFLAFFWGRGVFWYIGPSSSCSINLKPYNKSLQPHRLYLYIYNLENVIWSDSCFPSSKLSHSRNQSWKGYGQVPSKVQYIFHFFPH